MSLRLHLLFVAMLTFAYGFAQEIATPQNWTVLDEVQGDLDGDHIPEKVLIYNTADSTDFGKHREIRIFKKKDVTWVQLESSRTALLKSDDGGMMGDPYGGIDIKNAVLSIHHYGGSSWKWGYTDKYRFQNGQFELIGYSSTSGKPCEEWKKVDFNISTGKINIIKEYEDCATEEQVVTKIEKETFYKKGIILTLKHRKSNEMKIVSPELSFVFSL